MKSIIGFILYAIALLLYLPLSILNVIVVIYKNIKTESFFSKMNLYFKQEALAIDIFANTSLKTLWNTILRKKGGYPFGLIHDETISSVLGKNQRDKTLSVPGKILCSFLDLLDKDHCLSSIDSHLERRKNNNTTL